MMRTATKWAIGIGTAAGALGLVGLGVWEHKKNASPSGGGGGGGGGGQPTSFTLQPGATYSLSMTCPTDLRPLFPPVPVPPSAAANILLSGFPVTPQSFIFSSDGKTATLTFKYNGTQPVTIPAIQMSGATACSTSVSLVVAGPPQGGGGGGNMHQPQNVALQNGQTAQVANIAGGAVIVTTPGTITGINGAGIVKSWQVGSSSNQATIILSGWAGTISVEWSMGQQQQPTGGTIKVS